MAIPVVQLAEGATFFLAAVRLVLVGVARSESLIAFAPARTAVRVIAFSVRSKERVQSILVVRLAIDPLSGLARR